MVLDSYRLTMHPADPLMTDLAFTVEGGAVPSEYARPLWDAVCAVLPWLEEEPLAGLLPLRGTDHGRIIWLPQRTKLILRLPRGRVEDAQALTGHKLVWEEAVLTVGACRLRPHLGYPTLHAPLVATDLSETEFTGHLPRDLSRLGIAAQWICGRHRVLHDGPRQVAGFSLVVHQLKPEQSLRLQGEGLGRARHLGCGIFMPYKAIPNLE